MAEMHQPKEDVQDQRDVEPVPLSDPAREELAVLESDDLSNLNENVELLNGGQHAGKGDQDGSYDLATSTLIATETYRKKLFWLAVLLVCAVTFVSSLAVLCSLWSGPPNATIIAAYFASVTVQIVGVLSVVARSIFPSDHLQQVTDLYRTVDKTAPHRVKKSTPS